MISGIELHLVMKHVLVFIFKNFYLGKNLLTFETLLRTLFPEFLNVKLTTTYEKLEITFVSLSSVLRMKIMPTF